MSCLQLLTADGGPYYIRPIKTSPAGRVSGPDLSKHVATGAYLHRCDSTIHDSATLSSNKEQSAPISILPDCLWSLIIVSMDCAAPTWLQVWP